MTSNANKRSGMVLYSEKSDIYSHQVRIVLAEKGIPYDIENIAAGTISEDLMELNPKGSIPTLADREVTLFNAHIIMEYLDERFPHPPLMPVYPMQRGKYRLTMHNIRQDWYRLIDFVNKDPETKEAKKVLNQLRDEILSLGVLFSANTYFMSDDFSLMDCYIAPLLWRMTNLGVEFTGAGSKEVKAYMNRVFQRDSFLQSIGGAAPKHLMDDKD